MAMASASSLTFAELLRYHRTAAALTQEELAEKAHLSVDAISALERGARRKPRKETVTLLADALALSSDDRAVLLAIARRPPADSLAATPGEAVAHEGRSPALSAAPDELPRGIVTFLFADIEGSTHLLHHFGDDYADLLTTVHEVLRSIWLARNGHELGTQSDPFYAVFGEAHNALAAAAEAQRALAAHAWPTGARVRLRMGIHTGDARMTAGRYVGLEVHRAAQIAAAGHGGQTLVSQTVVDQLAKAENGLPTDVTLRSLGAHRLRDGWRRETLYQMALADVPNLPHTFPPLRARDLWPPMRARLVAGTVLTLTLLALVGLVLPFVSPTFPRALGVAAGLSVLLLGAGMMGMALARGQIPALLRRQWREARQPGVALTSVLLASVVVLTTLFATIPQQVVTSQQKGYDFSYTYHKPTHIGGTITVGFPDGLETLAVNGLGDGIEPFVSPIWQACVIKLPDQKLGLAGGGWQPDQCTEVPTVENGGESTDGKTTTFHIDPRAIWSDGVPLTADDFLFAEQMGTDPNIIGDSTSPRATLTALDAHTVQMRWDKPNGDYLQALWNFTPLPLHVYATGKFARIYNPATGAYNSMLAQQLRVTPAFNTTIPVDNGPFMIKSFKPDQQVILVKNPRFFSNYFHSPAWDQVIILSALKDIPGYKKGDATPIPEMQADVINMYRQGLIDLALGAGSRNLTQLNSIPKRQVIISPSPVITFLAFNQREQAPNAQANGGVSIFTDHTVRQAFVEAFDRCAAVRAEFGNVTCGDPNWFTDESDSTPSDQIYDPTFKLPGYNPTDAARLLDAAGYPVVDGIRRNKDRVTPLQVEIIPLPSVSASTALLQRLQQDYTRNLQIQVIFLDYKRAYDRAVSGDFDLMLGTQSGQADPIMRLTNDMGPFDRASIPTPQHPPISPFFNWFGIVDGQVTQRETLAAQTTSEEQRTLILRSLQRYFSGQFYVEPVYVRADISLTKPTLCNIKHWPQFGFDFWNIADWYIAPGSQGCP